MWLTASLQSSIYNSTHVTKGCGISRALFSFLFLVTAGKQTKDLLARVEFRGLNSQNGTRNRKKVVALPIYSQPEYLNLYLIRDSRPRGPSLTQGCRVSVGRFIWLNEAVLKPSGSRKNG
jgi:hypothetical protein